MSRVNWMAMAFVIALAAVAPAASAATPATPGARGAEATARSYALALVHRDVAGLCAVVPWAYRSGEHCREGLRDALRTEAVRHARVGAFLTRGRRARAVIDTVSGARGRLDAARTYLPMRRRHGRWGVIGNGGLPGVPYGQGGAPDLFPSGRAAALRRLADDELVGLSGEVGRVCTLLVPGGPLSGRAGACNRAVLFTFPTLDTGVSLRLASFAARLTAPDRARLDVGIAVTRDGGEALTTSRWTDRLHAVRRGGRWLLVKPPRSFYRVLGVPAPTDVDAPSATATWPPVAIAPGTLTERATPKACQMPLPFVPRSCGDVGVGAFATLATGGLALWAVGSTTEARAVVAGAAAGPTARVLSSAEDQTRSVASDGLVSVGDGALAIVRDEVDSAMTVLPLDATGRPRGMAQPLVPPIEEGGEPEDVPDPVVAAAAPGAATATLLTGDALVRLGPDGRRVVPDVPMTLRHDSTDDPDAVVAQPDGSLLAVVEDYDRISVSSLGPDGRPAGGGVHQRETLGDGDPYSLVVASDATGRALIAWVEEDAPHGRSFVRAWSYDPRAPLVSSPVTIAALRTRSTRDASPWEPAGSIALSALPGGGWGLGYVFANAKGADRGLWAARLDAVGTRAAGPRRIVGPPAGIRSGGIGFGLAGDTVAWSETPPVGMSQLHAAPLP